MSTETLDFSFLLPWEEDLRKFIEKRFSGKKFKVISFKLEKNYLEWILLLGELEKGEIFQVLNSRGTDDFQLKKLTLIHGGSYFYRDNSVNISSSHGFESQINWRQISSSSNWLFFQVYDRAVVKNAGEKSLLNFLFLKSDSFEKLLKEGEVYLLKSS